MKNVVLITTTRKKVAAVCLALIVMMTIVLVVDFKAHAESVSASGITEIFVPVERLVNLSEDTSDYNFIGSARDYRNAY